MIRDFTIIYMKVEYLKRIDTNIKKYTTKNKKR